MGITSIHRIHGFGEMFKFDIPETFAGKFEVMRFSSQGTPHTHDVEEIAVCTDGAGVVMVGETEYNVDAGRAVVIPAGVKHHMVPDGYMHMVILYAAKKA